MAWLYGKPVAEQILSVTETNMATMSVRPGLAVLLIGEDMASQLYVGLKEKEAIARGIHFEKYLFDAHVSEEQIISCIDILNSRSDIHGIIVQLPMPARLNTDTIIARIDPRKDADGFHPQTVQRFLAGSDEDCPVFPLAMIELLRSTGNIVSGTLGCVLVQSAFFGQVMVRALALDGVRGEYMLYSSLSSEQRERIRRMPVIMTALGVPGALTSEMLANDAIVIDGGISRRDGIVVGDVERADTAEKVRFLTPVPGGVGPVTIACLLRHVTQLAQRQLSVKSGL
ncbi:MAG: tetrahydrofolate dehydrogenase/cyclohydrolase catalytic domain-containing protein [Minisyncoccota bacterium]